MTAAQTESEGRWIRAVCASPTLSFRRTFAAIVAITLTLSSLVGPASASASANQVLAVESEGFRADAGHGLIIWSSYERTIHRPIG